ncbi:hypothetical protein V9T40_012698 [Parthenolecanium corni]|uniref:Uncharacterized protein n=1 Tax=Parthenolecanium corni TaxID=536013 RepID=A0AAN9T7R0_9HEMI
MSPDTFTVQSKPILLTMTFQHSHYSHSRKAVIIADKRPIKRNSSSPVTTTAGENEQQRSLRQSEHHESCPGILSGTIILPLIFTFGGWSKVFTPLIPHSANIFFILEPTTTLCVLI